MSAGAFSEVVPQYYTKVKEDVSVLRFSENSGPHIFVACLRPPAPHTARMSAKVFSVASYTPMEKF